MRLLVFNWQDRTNPLSGGAEIHLHEVFGRLVERGHDVTLVASGYAGAGPRTTLNGMDVHRTGGRHTFLLAARRYYRRRLRDHTFDLVIEDLNKVPLFSTVWAKEPVVLLVHHLFGATAFQEAGLPVAAATWLLEKPLPWFYGRAPVQAVSHSTAADLVARGFDDRRITVIENGIDLETYRPDASHPKFAEPTILYLGRLRRYKRVDLVLGAFARLVAQGVNARLIIAGTGPEAATLQATADRLGISALVRMPGFIDETEKLRLLRGAWVHVLASPKEGWGISNMEAAACGTPTVASDSPGLRDSVVHGETGLLAPHGDVAALAAALKRVLEQADLRTQLSQGALRFAQPFAWDRTADRTETHLLEQLQVQSGTTVQSRDAKSTRSRATDGEPAERRS